MRRRKIVGFEFALRGRAKEAEPALEEARIQSLWDALSARIHASDPFR
jgi:hypothetical protein